MNIYNLNQKKIILNNLYLISASFFFSLMTVCVKKIDDRIPIYELVFFRSILSLLITSYIIKKNRIDPWGKNRPLLILRGFLGTSALLCIFYSIRNLPLSISTVIQYTYPILISIFASFFIKEKLTKNIIVALLIGWLGILIILNPSELEKLNLKFEYFTIAIAFLGSMSTALAYITVKKLSFSENIFVIIKYFPLVSSIVLFPFVLINWVMPGLSDLFYISGIGIFTQLGQIFLTIGLKNLQATQASAINYLQVLFGSLWGITFFGEIITIDFLLGSLLVLLGTIITTSKKHKNI